jgi:hypothetical protein
VCNLSEFDKLLGKMYGNIIESIDFLMIEHKIAVKLKRYETEEDFIYFDVVFDEVFGFAWLNDGPIIGEWDFLSLEQIDDVKRTEVSVKGWEAFFDRYKCYPKICLEIWDSILIIDCSTMSVNGVSYKLDFPTH